MGAAASAVLSVAETPPPFQDFTKDGEMVLKLKKLSSKTLSSLPAFLYFSGVHTLVLDENDVSENLANTVVKVMRKCKHMQCFKIRKAFVGEEGVKKICRAMKQLNNDKNNHRCFLKSLHLISDPIDVDAARHLSVLLSKHYCSLTCLNLQENVLSDEGCAILAEALRKNPRSSLRILDLSSNNIADDGVVALADMLQSNKTLDTLSLSNNVFGDSPMLFLADALKSNETLETLKLNFCGIGDVGACLLAKALTLNSGLQCVFIEHNNFESKGAESIIDSLEVNASITSLSLDGNNLGGNIGSHLSRSLASNCTLTALSMKFIHITDCTKVAMTEALANNDTLKTFLIS